MDNFVRRVLFLAGRALLIAAALTGSIGQAQSIVLTTLDDLESLETGNSFSVDVAISGLTSQQSLDFIAARILYDETHIEATSVTPGIALPNSSAMTVASFPGSIEPVYDTLFAPPGATITDDVVLATIDFSVRSGGISGIGFSFLNVLGMDNGSPLSDLFVGDSLTVTSVHSGVYARGSSWSDEFLTKLDELGLGHPTMEKVGFDVTSGAEEFASIPWSNLDTITIASSIPISTNALTLLASADGPAVPSVETFQMLDDLTAEWKFDSPLQRNRYLLQHTDLSRDFRFNVLPGDTNRSGQVAVDDVAPIRIGLGTDTASDDYTIEADLNGSGTIAVNDVGPLRVNLGRGLPTDVPGSNVTIVPEPTSLPCLFLCLGALVEYRRRMGSEHATTSL